MLIVKVLLFLVGWIPNHDFHTTIMNFKYIEESKEFKADLTVDTEHFNHLLSDVYGVKLNLGMEGEEHPKADSLINDYLKKHIKLQFNNKDKELNLNHKLVTFYETTLYFDPICQKRKVKTVNMDNDFMLDVFFKQKNLINFYYLNHSESLLFEAGSGTQSLDLSN